MRIKNTSASERAPLASLGEVVANMAVNSGGKISLQDYFEPYEYIRVDAGDRDLSSGGVALLDPSIFKGTNGVIRLVVTIGKNGNVIFGRVIFILCSRLVGTRRVS